MNVFVAGARVVTILDAVVQERLNNIFNKNYTVLVGDAIGVDFSVQKYFAHLKYQNVLVYASNGKARNNAGGWEVRSIEVLSRSRGFDYYAVKDKAMADDADYGFMIWNGESKGTFGNIVNLLKQDKKSIVYLTINSNFYNIDTFDDFHELVNICGQPVKKLFSKLDIATVPSMLQQVSLF